MFRTYFIVTLLLATQVFFVHPRILRSTNFQPYNHFLQNDESIQKSDDGEGISVSEARRYLRTFGYLGQLEQQEDMYSTNNSIVNDNDDELGLEKAIKNFQEYYNLNVSGKLDPETTKLMMVPRCGVPDHHHHGINNNFSSNLFKVTSKYVFFQGIPQWPHSKTNLTYTFHPDSKDLAHEVVRDAFKVAFEQWSRVSHFTFEEVPKGTTSPDIVIGFYSGYHGDSTSFSKLGPVLAHAFAPPDGRLHVNSDKLWSTQVPIQKDFYDLVWVAMHEIGHTLGLGHSSHRDSIMYAFVHHGTNRRVLSADDIRGIRGLYSDPVRVDSHALALRCNYHHLLILSILCLLVIFILFDIRSELFD